MCGIAGFIDFKKTSGQTDLKNMTDVVRHRGPDGAGHWTHESNNYTLGFGHRRLSILDLSENGHQPMHFGDLHITFNGEIYNFQSVREDLKKLGHDFQTNCDTEVILHAYQQWGTDSLHHFRGMFAFVLFDATKQEVICVRDRVGVKPFFYSLQNGCFTFGSELKSLIAHPSFDKKLDHQAVAEFVQFGNIPSPKCIFQHTQKLQPGHILKIDLSKSADDAISQPKQYWSVYDAYNRPKLNIGLTEAKIATEKVLKEAFDLRMVADVPVGVFLSGGYDSTTLAAMLQKDATHKLETFTISVPDIGLNEAPYAKDIANHLGTNHHEMECSAQEALQIIPNLAKFYDEPFADSSAIPTTLLSQWVRKEVTVALSADGGDEIFAGYNRYDYLMRLGSKLKRIPGPLRKAAVSAMKAMPADKTPVFKNQYNFANRYEKLKNLLKDPSAEKMMWSLSTQYDDKEWSDLMLNPIEPSENAYHSKELKPEFYSDLAYMQAIDYETYLVDDIMQKVDRATMTASLEGREPYLDHTVIEYVAQLPDDFKYRNGEKKFLLKEIAHQYIPKSLLDRPKMGFAIPIESWMENELKALVEDYLSESRLQSQGIFNPSAVRKIANQFFDGRKELGFKLWYLVCFQMWYQEYMA